MDARNTHAPIITAEEFEAAQRPHIPGRRRSRHILSGRVRCGICGRRARILYKASGQDPKYRCWHRGQGCPQSRRSAHGLMQAMLLGLRMLTKDHEVQEAIRREAGRTGTRQGTGRTAPRKGPGVTDLEAKRRKLLDLFYADKISPDLFHEEETRLAAQIQAIREDAERQAEQAASRAKELERFEEVSSMLASIDIETLWAQADEEARRSLVEELVESIDFFPDHLEVKVAGMPRVNILPEEVGLRGPNVSPGPRPAACLPWT